MPKHKLCSSLMSSSSYFYKWVIPYNFFATLAVQYMAKDMTTWKNEAQGAGTSHTWDPVIASGIKNLSMRYSMARQNSCHSPHWCAPLQTGGSFSKSTVWQYHHRMLPHSISREIHCPVLIEMTWHNENNMVLLQTTTAILDARTTFILSWMVIHFLKRSTCQSWGETGKGEATRSPDCHLLTQIQKFMAA